MKIEYHILQSFPVTCLNRDDVGSPKTAIVGGVTRARVSSQCWKRQVRMALHEFDIKLGLRTKKLSDLLKEQMIRRGADSQTAMECAEHMAKELVDDTLVFVSSSEVVKFVDFAASHNFEKGKINAKELGKLARKTLEEATDALDIALFGRMVAKAPDMQVEAASCFSHAISTHAVQNEIEFFTALDDRQDEPGSAHMGTLEYNSATYYRYVSLNLTQIKQTLGAQDLNKAVEAFTKALFVAVPIARQTTQSGASPWEFARVLVRDGQRLQVPFETPVKAKNGGYLEPSIQFLKEYLDKKEQLCGSLFNKIASFDWGEDSGFSIDELVKSLQGTIAESKLNE